MPLIQNCFFSDSEEVDPPLLVFSFLKQEMFKSDVFLNISTFFFSSLKLEFYHHINDNFNLDPNVPTVVKLPDKIL